VHKLLTFTRRHNEAVTATTRRLETHRLGYLKILKQFGPVFLTSSEFKQRWRQVIKHYYRYLAVRVLQGKDKEFWDYQKAELANLEQSFSWSKLVASVGIQLIDIRRSANIFRKSRRQQHALVAETDHSINAWAVADSET